MLFHQLHTFHLPSYFSFDLTIHSAVSSTHSPWSNYSFHHILSIMKIKIIIFDSLLPFPLLISLIFLTLTLKHHLHTCFIKLHPSPFFALIILHHSPIFLKTTSYYISPLRKRYAYPPPREGITGPPKLGSWFWKFKNFNSLGTTIIHYKVMWKFK